MSRVIVVGSINQDVTVTVDNPAANGQKPTTFSTTVTVS